MNKSGLKPSHAPAPRLSHSEEGGNLSCDPSLAPVVVTYYVDEDYWALVEDYHLPCAGFNLRIPAGYQFDLASVPRFFWRVIAPFELSLIAPLVHDFLYQYKGHPPEGSVDPGRTFTRKEADQLFLELMRREGVVRWRQAMAYAAVRTFGSFPA